MPDTVKFNMTIQKRLFVLLTLLLLITGEARAVSLTEELGERQKGLQSIKASFDQEKRTELLNRPIRSKGTVYFKAQGGVRWEYDGSMLVIYDGKTVYVHYLGMEEADKVVGASEYIGPLTFDVPTLVRDYKVEAKRADKDIVLDLKPKKRMPFATMRMTFGPQDSFPREISITEESGDSTTIKFRDIFANIPIKDAQFVFTPPKGVTLKERNFSR